MRFSTHASVDEAEALIRDYISRGSSFAIRQKADDAFVGVFTLHPDEREKGCLSMSLFLSQAFWNQGYATDLVRAVREAAVRQGNVRALSAYVVKGNVGSRRALQRNGFAIIQRWTFDDLSEELLVYRLPLEAQANK